MKTLVAIILLSYSAFGQPIRPPSPRLPAGHEGIHLQPQTDPPKAEEAPVIAGENDDSQTDYDDDSGDYPGKHRGATMRHVKVVSDGRVKRTK